MASPLLSSPVVPVTLMPSVLLQVRHTVLTSLVILPAHLAAIVAIIILVVSVTPKSTVLEPVLTMPDPRLVVTPYCPTQSSFAFTLLTSSLIGLMSFTGFVTPAVRHTYASVTTTTIR